MRPTGLLDPEIEVIPSDNQVEVLYDRAKKVIEAGNRVLITTLTKKMAEELSKYYLELGLKVRYMHSDIDAIERNELIRGLRRGEYDILIGINLLREGLDLPEVALVAVMDADKEAQECFDELSPIAQEEFIKYPICHFGKLTMKEDKTNG